MSRACSGDVMGLKDLLSRGQAVEAHRPFPSAIVDVKGWRSAIVELESGRISLLSLWAEPKLVHMALLEGNSVAVLSLPCTGTFPSVGARHAPAIRLERAIHDLYGLIADGAEDSRPWLDHGRWSASQPLSATPALPDASPYPFLEAEGENLHQIPVGPVHAGIIEPGHFRFTASGETVVRLEERLGYVHKGIDGLFNGASLERAASLASHISGDSAVAYSIAFSRAVEAALDFSPPPRAVYLRALMAELERLANHFGDFGAICNDASFSLMHAHCGILREEILRVASAAFGHRLMMDRIVPGGLARDVDPQGLTRIDALINDIGRRFPALIEIYDATASLQDRTVGTGILAPEPAKRFATGGYVGRASGRNFDARRDLSYAPYDELAFDVPLSEKGDVDARVWIRIREIEQSLSLVKQIVSQLPSGPTRTDVAVGSGEGLVIAEGFRGDVLAWVRLNGDGTIARCHMRDPSWFQWPLLEGVIEGNIVADFPLCNKSFNCSYSGHDL
jgi:Ni,Fe-hydrogenase III large subunit